MLGAPGKTLVDGLVNTQHFLLLSYYLKTILHIWLRMYSLLEVKPAKFSYFVIVLCFKRSPSFLKLISLYNSVDSMLYCSDSYITIKLTTKLLQ